jgi:hypothetical protein
MPDVFSSPHHVPATAPGGGDHLHIPFMFRTNGSGAPSLDYDYDGALVISRPSGNNYRLSFGDSFKSCLQAYTNNSIVGYAIVVDPVAGYVEFQYAGAITSNTYHGKIVLDLGYR